jgi:probable rRNA maturation factor
MLYIDFSATDKFDELGFNLKSTVRQAVKATLLREGFESNASVSVTFCDNAYIRELNKKFRNVDRHTDVLSFPLYEADELVYDDPDAEFMLGDIVISLERAKEQAQEIGNDFYREIAFLAVHSTLHLLGYDHERSREEDELQCRLQREIIETLDLLF